MADKKLFNEDTEINKILNNPAEDRLLHCGISTVAWGTIGSFVTGRSIIKMSHNEGGRVGFFIGLLCISSAIKSGKDCYKIAKYIKEKRKSEKLGKDASEIKTQFIKDKSEIEDVSFEVKENNGGNDYDN